MLSVVLSGGIGSGKSLVRELLESYDGVEGLSMDDVAKQLMVENDSLSEELQAAFGKEIYSIDGRSGRRKLNREILGKIVFSSSSTDNVNKINSIVHPYVFRYSDDAEKRAEAEGVRVLVKETALLHLVFEKTRMDRVILVDADEEIRIERSMKRGSGLAYEQAKGRIRNQPDWRSPEIVDRCDFVISNSGTLNDLKEAVRSVIDKLLDT